MRREAQAFCPAGISSFFEICDRDPNGVLIGDPEQIGARGGGFAINKGVLTQVITAESEEKRVKVFLNGKLAPQAKTSKMVANTVLEEVNETYKVTVKHKAEVPIGAGFGSSAAGALGTALSVSKTLDLDLTYNQIGRIAHVAEVRCRTGLGTVGPLILGGCILTVEPGAPGYASIDQIPVSPNHRIVAGFFKSRPTKDFLASPERKTAINEWGRKTGEFILAKPSLQNFMSASKEFAIRTGMITKRVRRLIEAAEKAGAIGAAQNMIGEAVHALVTVFEVDSIVQAFEKFLPPERVIVAEIDLLGARLLEKT